jgi:hypothetical protein
MKYSNMRIFSLAVAFVMLPLYESGAASVDNILGRTYLEIEPELNYGLQYEDNIDNDVDGQDRISDWSNHYRPGVTISLVAPRFSLDSRAELDIAEYINEKDFNYVDQDYSVGLGYIPTERLEFSLGGAYSIDTSNERYEDIAAIDPTDEYDRYKDKTTEFEGGFSYDLTTRSSIGLTGNFSQYDSSATDGSEFYALLANYTYGLSARTDLLLNLGYFYYDFDGNNNNSFDPDGLYYDYSTYSYEMKNYSIQGGVEHMFENDGKLRAMFGMRYSDTESTEWTNTDPDSKTSGNGNGWVGSLEYQKRFNAFLFGFEASQDVSVSPEGANYDATSFIVRTDYRISQRLAAKLDLRLIRSDNTSDDEFIGGAMDSQTYIVQPYLTYLVYRWLSAGIGYQFRYTEDNGGNDRTTHSNLFYLDLRLIPLRSLVLR